MATFYIGDFGLDIEITAVDSAKAVVVIDSGATTTMIFTNPDGTELTKAAALTTDGSDGKFKYTLDSGFLSMAGKWRVRGRIVEGSSKSFKTSQLAFQVEP